MKKLIFILFILPVSFGFSGTIRYVSPAGSHIPPFDDWSSSATNIQDVVNLSADGDTVLIGSGGYFLVSEITVTNAVKLVGASDLDEIIINGGGITRCFNLFDVDCVISGITVTNGFSDDEGGGIYGEGRSPIITNCVVTGSSAYSGGGIYGCRIYYSTIKGNSADYEGGGTTYSEVYYSTISGNTAVDYGGGISYGTALNCLIYNNSSLDEGGGFSDGTLTNCVIHGNTATGLGGGVAWGKLYNCTAVDNSSYMSGGGTYRCLTYNSITYYNSATISDSDIHHSLGDNNSCSLNLVHRVDGNITNAPWFLDFSEGNYHLQIGPCKDAGNNTYVSASTDLDGNVRIADGIVDMGAFESGDFDGDGMEDSWEIYYFGSANALPNADGDIDLFSNLAEYIVGTDPMDPDSFPFFTVTTDLPTGSFVFEWPSLMEREYVVLWAKSMTNNFQQISSTIDYPQASYTDTVYSAESSGFYRVNVQLK